MSFRYGWLLILLSIGAPREEAGAPSPPNILLILTDDQGWSQVCEPMDPRVESSCSKYLETPAMSRLMREGMRFSSGYAATSTCTPSRRSLLCGTTTARSGSEAESDWIPAQHTTIPKALKAADASYRCAHFGKWGEEMVSSPQDCGYDASDGMTTNAEGGLPVDLEPDKGAAVHLSTAYVDDDDPKRTRSVTDRAIAFMREESRAGRPFFVQVSYYAPHYAIVSRSSTLARYRAEEKGEPDRGYLPEWAAMLTDLDQGIGRLLEALDELALARSTWVVLTSDNGGVGALPELREGKPEPNHPLVGSKHSLNEGGIRVPFVVRGPGVPAGTVCRRPVAAYDLLPTFADLAGGPVAAEDIDGVSLRPLFADPAGELERPAVGLVFHRPRRGWSAARRGDLKLLVRWSGPERVRSSELYRLEPWPWEDERTLVTDLPELAQEWLDALRSYLAAVDAEWLRSGTTLARRGPRGK